MIVTIVHVKVKPGCVEAFKRECLANHAASVKEAGNRRFDVLQKDGEPECFELYEAYASKEAAAAHKETAHYKAWREAVAEMMAQPRAGTAYTAIAPE
jgi:autoinducer 2-degrading protein